MANIAATISLNVPAITALTKGEPGNSILNGSGAPSAGIGNNGDFYIDTLTFYMYGPKNGGIWGTPILLNNNASAPLWNSGFFTLTSLSASWSSSYTTTNANSAKWNSAYTTAGILSSDTTLRTNSASWTSVYTTVCANSATWGAGTSVAVLDRLNSVYTTVSGNSGTWGTGGGGGDAAVNALVRSNSGFWESTYDTVASISGNWNATYNTVRATSGNWNGAYTFVSGVSSVFASNSAQWGSAYTVTNANSASWNSTTSTLSTTSATWNAVYTATALNSGGWDYAFNGITLISPATARWDSVSYNYMFGASANYDSTYTTVASLSDYWTVAYNGVVTLATVVPTLTANGVHSALTVIGSMSAGIGEAAGGNVSSDGLRRYGSGLSASDFALIPGKTFTGSKTITTKFIEINVGGTIYFIPLYQ